MRKLIAFMLLWAFVFNGGGPAIASAQVPGTEPTLAGEFVSGLPVGTKTKLRLNDGRTIKGTIMSIEENAVMVKVNTRLPEPPLRIELGHIVDADIDRGANVGKAIAIGAAAGAGAALGVIMLLVAIYAD